MKKIMIFALALVILSTLTACSKQQEDNKTVIKEPDKSITVIDKEEDQYEEPSISVDRIIKPLNVLEITDWLDEQNIVVVMENKDLEKMSLLEKADRYSRGIYLYNIETMEAEPIIIRKNMFLGGAKLSPNKKYLLYHEYSIGDSAFYVMSMNEKNQEKDIKDGALGLAITAKWTEDNEIIGVSYAGGAYTTDDNWNLAPAYDLQDEQLYTVIKGKNKICYITVAENLDLHVLDLETNEKMMLDLKNVDGVIPSPDGEQLLLTQSTETDRRLYVADMYGNILRTIAEGIDITGVTWSPDQSMIAYQSESLVNGVNSKDLYIYDVLAGESKKIADNISASEIVWSPSGDKIAVSQYSDTGHNNLSIIYLNK